MNKIFKNRPSQRVFRFFSKKHLDRLLPWTWARSRANFFFKNKFLWEYTKKLREEIKRIHKKNIQCILKKSLTWTWTRSRAQFTMGLIFLLWAYSALDLAQVQVHYFFKILCIIFLSKIFFYLFAKFFCMHTKQFVFEKNICPGPGPGPGQKTI